MSLMYALDRGRAVAVDENANVCGDVVVSPSSRFLIRLEDTVLAGHAAAEGATEVLRSLEGRYVLVSSNSRDTARSMQTKLKRAGLTVPMDALVLAGEEALRYIAARYPGARCMVLASRVLSYAAGAYGLSVVQDRADVILLGRDAGWTYKRLLQVVNEQARGAVIVAANSDAVQQREDGRIVPDTGALAASVMAATRDLGRDIEQRNADTLFAAGMARMNAHPRDTLLISAIREDYGRAVRFEGLSVLAVDHVGGVGRWGLSPVVTQMTQPAGAVPLGAETRLGTSKHP